MGSATPVHATCSTRKPCSPLSVTAIVLGTLVAVAGLWFVGAYVFGAIVDRLGEPDQSLLFWYLPLLFIGIALSGLGGGAIALVILRHRRVCPSSSLKRNTSSDPDACA